MAPPGRPPNDVPAAALGAAAVASLISNGFYNDQEMNEFCIRRATPGRSHHFGKPAAPRAMGKGRLFARSPLERFG